VRGAGAAGTQVASGTLYTWGPSFREEAWMDELTESRVHARIAALAAYVESIQIK
jgi:hypothetical protein